MTLKTLLLAPLLACLALATQATAAPKLYHGRGVVEEIRKGGKVLVIDHEAIPGLMEAMTMPFELKDAGLAKGIKVGDSIRFTLVQKGHFWPIIALKKIHSAPVAPAGAAVKPVPTAAMNMPM